MSAHTTYEKPSLPAERWIPEYQIPPHTDESKILILIDAMYVDLRYLKENVRELEELFVALIQDRDENEVLFPESVLPA